MEDLLNSGSIGGSAVTGPAAEVMLDKECKKNACCPSMALKTRFICFAVCWALGFTVSILALFGSLIGFSVLYTIGTVLTISGSFFLWGPMSQLKKAFDPDRRIATIVLLLLITMVLVSALAI